MFEVDKKGKIRLVIISGCSKENLTPNTRKESGKSLKVCKLSITPTIVPSSTCGTRRRCRCPVSCIVPPPKAKLISYDVLWNIMHNSQRIHLFIGILALSSIIVFGLQCQQYTFGQTNQTSASSEEQEFKSAFDTFVYTDPGGYGNYEEKKSNVFKPGETFWLYLEPTGFSYGNVTDDGNRLYTINFTAGFHISKNGEILSGQENLPLIDFASHRQNKEISLDFSIDQTEPFPPGDYVITYTVTDENSGKSFDVRKDVTVHE